MSVRAFAAHLGVAVSSVANWERRGELIRLRGETQEILDSDLSRAPEEVRHRFQTAVEGAAAPQPQLGWPTLGLAPTAYRPVGRAGGPERLAEAADSPSGPSGSAWTSGTPQASAAVAATQHHWRTTRRFLNEHRSDLARRSVQLYPAGERVGMTSLISLPEWLPTAPVDLADIDLRWRPDASPARVCGAEPEARQLLPLYAPGQQHDTYTSAVRYLDRPVLFENRPSYRLLEAAWPGGRGQMTFGPATYFDKLDLSEAVGHEYAQAVMHGPRNRVGPAWAHLPFRSLVGDPFDCVRRAVIPAVTTLTIRVDAEGAAFLLHWRDPTRVATAGGMYDVIPAGEFQPSSVALWDQTNDFDLWRNIVRELSEELLGTPEHDGSRSAPVDYDAWPLYGALHRARTSGLLYAGCLGIGLDALTLAATILTVIVIDGRAFDDIFGDIVGVNSEGCTVAAAEGRRAAEGIPFDEANVERLLHSEPLAPPGAACLHLAWQHRSLLLAAETPLGGARRRGGST